MFKFLKGIKSAITTKAVTKDQVLFSTDSHQLSFDIQGTGGTTQRYHVQDPSAAKSLAFSNKVITLKDADGNTLNSIDISSPTTFFVDPTDGHLYYQVADTAHPIASLNISGDLSVGGDATIEGDLTTNGIVTVTGE